MSDLIRRDDVYDILKKVSISGMPIYVFDKLWNGVRDLPSAEPERKTMVWKPAKGRPAYEKGICNCGYVLSVLQRDFVYCPMCGCRLEWNE